MRKFENKKPSDKTKSGNKSFNKNTKNRTKRNNQNTNCGKPGVYELDDNDAATPHNDVNWYKRVPGLFETSVRVNPIYNYAKNLSTTVLGGVKDERYTPASLMSISVAPTIGHVASEKDQVNVAFDAMYTFIRHASTVSSNYDAVDLGMYVIAAANLVAAMNWAMRLYAISQTNMLAGINPSLPVSAAAAENMDLVEFQSNGAQFVNRFNVFSNKVSSLVVPGSFYYFDKVAEPFTYILTESPIGSMHDQLYMFKPSFFYKMEENSSTHEWYLAPSWIPNTTVDKLTTSKVITYLEGLLTTLFAWRDDVTLMASDILKSFGSESVIRVPVLNEATLIVPKYDPIVLNQIKNMTCLKPTEGFTIAQDSTHRYLKCELMTNQVAAARVLAKDAVISFPEPDLTTDLAFEYSRLKTFTRQSGVSSRYYIYSGAIMPMWIDIYEVDSQLISEMQFFSDAYVSALDVAMCVEVFSKFAYAPMVMYDVWSTDETIEELHPAWQIDNLAVVPTTNMFNMLDVEYASLFNAGAISELYPKVARYSNGKG